jgi:hypothetical protein
MADALSWHIAARERAECAVSKLRSLQQSPDQPYADELLHEATEELRATVNHCEDSARAKMPGNTNETRR